MQNFSNNPSAITKDKFIATYEAILREALSRAPSEAARGAIFEKLSKDPFVFETAVTELASFKNALVIMKSAAEKHGLSGYELDQALQTKVETIQKEHGEQKSIHNKVDRVVRHQLTIHKTHVESLAEMKGPKFIPGTDDLIDQSKEGLVIFPFNHFEKREFMPGIGRVDELYISKHFEKAIAMVEKEKNHALVLIDLKQKTLLKELTSIEARSGYGRYMSPSAKYFAQEEEYLRSDGIKKTDIIAIHDLDKGEAILDLSQVVLPLFGEHDSNLLVMVSGQKSVRYVDLDTKQNTLIDTGGNVREYLFTHEDKEILTLSDSAESNAITVTFTDTKTKATRLSYEIGGREMYGNLNSPIPPRTAAITRDGKYLIVGWGMGDVTVHEASTGKMLLRHTFEPNPHGSSTVQYLLFSEDQKSLFALSSTGEAITLNLSEMTVANEFSVAKHPLVIYGADLSQDGKSATVTLLDRGYVRKTFFIGFGDHPAFSKKEKP